MDYLVSLLKFSVIFFFLEIYQLKILNCDLYKNTFQYKSNFFFFFVISETIPRGDIILEYNSGVPLEITCILDPDNAIVQSQLRQLSNNNSETQLLSQWIVFYKYAERVPKQYVSIINATAAQLRIPNPPAGLNIYDCILLLDNQRRLNNDSYDTNSSAQLSTLSVDSSKFSTVQPTSLETSGPPPLMPQEAGTGVCLNTVHVGCK
jgi:hypothetical protein